MGAPGARRRAGLDRRAGAAHARGGFVALAALLILACAPRPATCEAAPPDLARPWPGETSLLALETAVPPPAFAAGYGSEKGSGGVTAPSDESESEMPVFNAERAKAFLQSLTVPGWGQAALGHRTAARVYFLVELGIWTAYTSFRVQAEMRQGSYETSAKLLAGIDLHGRDQEFQRIVGSYLSSDEYNQFVVYRDAANLFLSDPNHLNYAGYRAYIAEHSLGGQDRWNWENVESLLRYRSQRQDMQRAEQRANTALILAGLNRLISAVHAARQASHPGSAPRSWNLEVSPSDVQDPTAFRLQLQRRF